MTLPPWLRNLLQLIFTVGVTWLILTRVGVTAEEIMAAPGSLPELGWGWLLLSALVLLLGFLLSARSWGWMVGELGGVDPGRIASMRIVLIANLGRYLPGKLWQIAGLALLGRNIGIPATVSTVAGLLGQGFGLAAAGILALPILVANRAAQGEGASIGPILLALLLIVLLLVVSVPALLRRCLAMAFRIAGLPPEGVPRGRLSFGPRWLGWHLLIWGIYGAGFLLFIEGVGFDGSHLFFASAFAAAYLLGYIALFAPAGIGIREGFLIVFLRPEVGASALAIALLARIWITVVELVPAGALALHHLATSGKGAA